jgi:hypothetical protein
VAVLVLAAGLDPWITLVTLWAVSQSWADSLVVYLLIYTFSLVAHFISGLRRAAEKRDERIRQGF